MSKNVIQKLITEQVNELTKTVNDLEKRARKVIQEGKKSKTVKDLTKKVSDLTKKVQKDPRLQLLVKIKNEAMKAHFLDQYLPVRKKDLKSLENKLTTINKKLDDSNICPHCLPLTKSIWASHIGKILPKEKGIDVMIAIDMICKSIIQKECDCCILVSGDADFLPSLDIINNAGFKVCSSAPLKGYSYELRQKYPNFILDKDFLQSSCSKSSAKT